MVGVGKKSLESHFNGHIFFAGHICTKKYGFQFSATGNGMLCQMMGGGHIFAFLHFSF